MRMCGFCMIACAMVFLIKGVQHGIVFSSTPCLKAGIFSISRPYPSSLPNPHSQPPQTLSSLASRLFTNTHKCVNTKPQPPSFPSFVNTPNKAVLSLEKRPKRSTKQFLLVVFDVEIFKIAANKQ